MPDPTGAQLLAVGGWAGPESTGGIPVETCGLRKVSVFVFFVLHPESNTLHTRYVPDKILKNIFLEILAFVKNIRKITTSSILTQLRPHDDQGQERLHQ